MPIFIVFAIVVIAYLLAIKGRSGHKDFPALRKWLFAHRGLHREGVPENSMAAFTAAKAAGYGIELDVHLMQDGNLAVIHDASLQRTAGVDARIEELTSGDLDSYSLEGTTEKIPLFSDVLSLIGGAVPLVVELKSVNNNYPALCAAVCKMLQDYDGLYCLESFDPRCIAWLRKHKCKSALGQLAYNSFRDKHSIPWILQFCMKYNLLFFLTRPDFVAYCFPDRKTLSNFLCRKLWRMQGVAWTIRTKEDLAVALKEGWLPIFENIMP